MTNERIKEIAKQAHEDVIKNTPSFLVTRELYEQKFAELIVKECADFINSHEQVDKYGEAMDVVHGEDLLTHFGVEI